MVCTRCTGGENGGKNKFDNQDDFVAYSGIPEMIAQMRPIPDQSRYYSVHEGVSYIPRKEWPGVTQDLMVPYIPFGKGPGSQNEYPVPVANYIARDQWPGAEQNWEQIPGAAPGACDAGNAFLYLVGGLILGGLGIMAVAAMGGQTTVRGVAKELKKLW